ncbi:hypothetical protein CA13_73700 [Planctomycetes bacterium CA13]|uniref:Uncharacterized protein n=1 Tax=Novipirellula herctigrandis TaxID=2527986 RepID=A0A5C5YLV8_9BACT|nr:hypothetical protein CA13_73700 [Planctomycetes bacterium CA13]
MPPVDEGPSFVASTRRRALTFLLPLAFVLTFALGTFNAIDEQNGLRLTVIGSLGSVVSQLPGLMIAYVFYRRRSTALAPLLLASYFVALTGIAAYLNYATNGKSDSLNSAAHMHVVMFPMLHCFLAFAVYSAAGLIAAAIAVLPSSDGVPSDVTSGTIENCSICKIDVNRDDDYRCPKCRWPI